MKKLSLYIFLFLLCFNFLNKANAIPKKGNGQGDLALSEDIIKEFHSYITTQTKNNPFNFFITADHKNVFIEIRKNTTSIYKGISGSGPIARNKKKCENKYKQECFLFANQRIIVWNNGINPIDSKKSKIKRKTSYDELVIKLNKLGFIETKEQKAAKEKKIIKKVEKEKLGLPIHKISWERGKRRYHWKDMMTGGTEKNKSWADAISTKGTYDAFGWNATNDSVESSVKDSTRRCELGKKKYINNFNEYDICIVYFLNGLRTSEEEKIKFANIFYGKKKASLAFENNPSLLEKPDTKEKKITKEKVAKEKKITKEKVAKEKKITKEKLNKKLSLIPAETDLKKAQNFLNNLQDFIKLYPDEFDILKISEFFILIKPVSDGNLDFKSKEDVEAFVEFANTSDSFVKYNNDIEKEKRDNKLNKINDAISSLENNIKIIKGFLLADTNSIYLEEWLNTIKNVESIINDPSSYDQLLLANDDLIRLRNSKNEIDRVTNDLNNNIDELKEILKQNLTTDLAPLIIEQSKILELAIKNQILNDMKLTNQKFEEFIFKTIEEPKLKATKDKKIIKDKQLAEEKIIKEKQLAKEKKLRDKQLAKEKMSNEIKKWWESF